MPENRASRRASKFTLDEWSHDRLLTIELPSVTEGKPDRTVEVEVPDFFMLANRGLIPNPLRGIAEKAESLFDPAEATEEEKAAYFDFVCWTVGRQLRSPNLVEELGSEELAQAWVADNMPNAHRLLIWQRCMHLFTEADARAFQALAAAMLEAQGAPTETPPVRGLDSVATFPEGSVSAESPGGSGADGKSAL